jgi:iron(III) transport system ATP-binding protein
MRQDRHVARHAGLETDGGGIIAFGGRSGHRRRWQDQPSQGRRSLGNGLPVVRLWPHMTVRKSIPSRHERRRRREAWVDEIAGAVDCAGCSTATPGPLGGGQQLCVALARGVVANPELILFDEPSSNLDAGLRAQVRNALTELHNHLGSTMSTSRTTTAGRWRSEIRLTIMRAGSIEQQTPCEVFATPRSEDVAGFRHGQPPRVRRRRRRLKVRRRCRARRLARAGCRRHGPAAGAHRRPRRGTERTPGTLGASLPVAATS